MVIKIVSIEIKLKFRKKLENNVITLIEKLCNNNNLTYEFLKISRKWYKKTEYTISVCGEINKVTFVSDSLPKEVKNLK